MTLTEQIEYIRSTVAGDLPARLTAAGVPDMEDYIGQTPYGDERRQFAVFLGSGESDIETDTTVFLVQLTLPRYEFPDKYLTPVLESLIDVVSASEMGFSTLNGYTWQVLYPGDFPEGGSSSFIQIVMEYERSMDDCS